MHETASVEDLVQIIEAGVLDDGGKIFLEAHMAIKTDHSKNYVAKYNGKFYLSLDQEKIIHIDSLDE